jgi:methionyl-tRNA synthetase
MISFQEFKKLDLKIAEIKEANDHPNADKLYVLKVELACGEERQIVAGIKGCYKKEDLLGRQIVLVANLEPAVIRGVESRGMLLATQDEKGISVLSPDRKVSLGSPVR